MEQQMGLHSGEYAAHKHPVVFHPELSCDRALPLWYGRNDPLENPAQGHRKVRSEQLTVDYIDMLVLRYNQIDSGEDAQEEFGWKLVHGDVFRFTLINVVQPNQVLS